MKKIKSYKKNNVKKLKKTSPYKNDILNNALVKELNNLSKNISIDELYKKINNTLKDATI